MALITYDDKEQYLVNPLPDVNKVTAGDMNEIKAVVNANASAGISDGDKGDITVSSSGTVWTIDNGATAKYVIDQASASTAGGTITLDMNSQIQRSFVGSATFATAKAIALSNTTNSLFFNFFFEVTNIAAELTPPSDWLMAVEDFDGTDWTPPATGKYEIGGSLDDTNNLWYVKIAGPFT